MSSLVTEPTDTRLHIRGEAERKGPSIVEPVVFSKPETSDLGNNFEALDFFSTFSLFPTDFPTPLIVTVSSKPAILVPR